MRRFRPYPPQRNEEIRTIYNNQYAWNYQNDGGINVFTAAISVNILTNLAIGGAFNFYSGTENLSFSTKVSSFDENTLYNNTQQYSRTSFHAGIHYQYNQDWIFGVNIGFPHVLDIKQEFMTENSNLVVNNVQIFFPYFFNFAVAYQVNKKLNVTADYFYRPWQKVEYRDNDLDFMYSDHSLSALHLGGEYKLIFEEDVVSFRLGYYHDPTIYKDNSGQQISYHVMTTGFGWRAGDLIMNLGFEWIPFNYETGRLNTAIPGLPFEIPVTSFNSHAFHLSFEIFLRIS
jgi:hypothetical protein